MTRIEISGKKYDVPESFDEMTLEQYCKAFFNLSTASEDDDESLKVRKTIENESVILSRILGESDDFCLNLPVEIYTKMKDKISFVYDIEGFIRNAKAGITIDGKRYKIPSHDEMSLRQYIDADMVMNETENDMQYIELLSVLLSEIGDDGKPKQYDGKYKEMKDKLTKVKCSDALPLVFHFFKKSVASKTLTEAFMKEGVTQYHQPTQDS